MKTLLRLAGLILATLVLAGSPSAFAQGGTYAKGFDEYVQTEGNAVTRYVSTSVVTENNLLRVVWLGDRDEPGNVTIDSDGDLIFELYDDTRDTAIGTSGEIDCGAAAFDTIAEVVAEINSGTNWFAWEEDCLPTDAVANDTFDDDGYTSMVAISAAGAPIVAASFTYGTTANIGNLLNPAGLPLKGAEETPDTISVNIGTESLSFQAFSDGGLDTTDLTRAMSKSRLMGETGYIARLHSFGGELVGTGTGQWFIYKVRGTGASAKIDLVSTFVYDSDISSGVVTVDETFATPIVSGPGERILVRFKGNTSITAASASWVRVEGDVFPPRN